MSHSPHIETFLCQEPVSARGLDTHGTSGAEVVFIGRTRGERHPDHGALRHLTYECHEPMAVTILQELAEEASTTWHLERVRVQHAVGVVPPGAASVAIEVLAGHRGEGFEACRWLIDTLKQRLPIWKQEVWEDGTTWVEGQPVEPRP